MNRNSILVGQRFQAYILGLLAITGFSLTLPATKFAVPFFGVMAVGMGFG